MQRKCRWIILQRLYPISPLKNAEKLNEIGDALAEEYGIAYLNSDFKKKNGYKRSVELSEQYGMYRQYYCGCVFQKPERQGDCPEESIRGRNIKEENTMAQLWGGRFTKETDQLVYNFNASITFDQKFYKQDIEGSIAHVTMLAKQGILTEQERDDIVRTLKEIRDEVESGRLRDHFRIRGYPQFCGGKSD